MKIKPEILMGGETEIFQKKILISGNDESLISCVKNYVVEDFKNKNYSIDNSGEYNKNLVGDLFSDKKVLFVLADYPADDSAIENSGDKHSVLVISSNNKKINKIKSAWARSKETLVVDCYLLDRAGMQYVLKRFSEQNKIQFSKEVFWYIIENCEKNYVLFLKQLQTLSLYSDKINNIDEVEKIIFIENKVELNRIFFNILRPNKFLIKLFNKNIYSQTDFYVFLNSFKGYLEIISASENKMAASSNLPRYLFADRDAFLNIYGSLDKKKILKIYKNLQKVESLVRKNSTLYFSLGLRFLLSTKKIIIS
tara:strand:- start:11309 stop:12238 length:930 start_codon:yes stop_codon:yes gene_type:complete